VGLSLIGQGLGQEGLASPWRAVKEHTLGRCNPKPIEQLRMLEWQLDDLPDFTDYLAQPADVVVGDIREAGLLGLYVLRQELHLCLGIDTHNAGRDGTGDDQAHLAQPDRQRAQQASEELLRIHPGWDDFLRT